MMTTRLTGRRWWLFAVALFIFTGSTAVSQEQFTREDYVRLNNLYKQSLRIAKVAMQYRPGLALKLGDTLPEIDLKMVMHGRSHIKTTDLRGKYIILSFWNTYCSYCLDAFEQMEPLRQKYNDTLCVLPVTFEVKESVEWLYERRNIAGKAIQMPSVVADSVLRQFFPHYGDPFDVWIDQWGVVKLIAGPAMFTEDNLLAFFAGKKLASDPKRYPFRPKK